MTNLRIRTISLAVIVLAAASAAAADVNLAGEYWFGSLSADASTNVPWCERGTVVVTGNNWTQEWADYDGNHIFSSTFTTAVQSDGSININLSSGSYNVAWNGNVMIHADTAPDANNRLGIDIITRKATNVDVNDLIGEYRFFDHWLGWDDRYDGVGWGNGQFDANGTIVDTWVNSDGNTETYTSTWTLDDVNGIGYITGFPHPFLLGKGGIITVFRPTIDINPDIGYTLIIKKTSQTITPAEMAGTYQVRFLETGPGGVPYTCGQGICVIDANGMIHVDANYSDGEHDVFDANYTIGPGNAIDINGGGNVNEGIISPDKGLIFVPEYICSNPRNSYDWIGGIILIRTFENDIADLNGDGVVDWADLAILFSHWLETSTEGWTWVSGSGTVNQAGIYGTKSVADPNNVPGARADSISWIDVSGNLWLFGGSGYSTSGSGYLNDLWKFDGTNWIWVSGSNTENQYGVYGTKGVAAPDNIPGARFGSVSWIDANGNFWIFGGFGYYVSYMGYLNDLWKFDGTNWTWISGSDNRNQFGVYGTKGVADPNNVPGARMDSISWIDASNNLWLFGGNGFAASSSGFLNDLWKFDGTNWTWVSGPNTANQNGIYGTKGVVDPNNVPGARRWSASWIDGSGNLWLFGGEGYSTSSRGYLNDLWKFDGNNWMWASGLNITNQSGVYGTKGVAAPGNTPGARFGSVSWIDSYDNLWLFGGEGKDASGNDGKLNDLWKFDGTNWTWISGFYVRNQFGVYGTKGVADLNNVPGARPYSISWIDGSDNLWLFGGYGYGVSGNTGYLNDLWKFNNNKLIGDLNGDGIVNFEDYAILVSHWTSGPYPVGDFTGDFKVDFSDLYRLMAFWLSSCSAPDWCDGTDIDQSGLVDFVDFALFAQHWLEGVGQ
jgi:hypothetical protein